MLFVWQNSTRTPGTSQIQIGGQINDKRPWAKYQLRSGQSRSWCWGAGINRLLGHRWPEHHQHLSGQFESQNYRTRAHGIVRTLRSVGEYQNYVAAVGGGETAKSKLRLCCIHEPLRCGACVARAQRSRCYGLRNEIRLGQIGSDLELPNLCAAIVVGIDIATTVIGTAVQCPATAQCSSSGNLLVYSVLNPILMNVVLPKQLQFPPKEYFQNVNDPDVRRDMEEVIHNTCSQYILNYVPSIALISKRILSHSKFHYCFVYFVFMFLSLFPNYLKQCCWLILFSHCHAFFKACLW